MMPSAVGSIGLGVMAGALSLPHDGTEALYTVIGVGILALGAPAQQHRRRVIARIPQRLRLNHTEDYLPCRWLRTSIMSMRANR